jgi:nucleotide-binding universal stress UspA family protein
MSRPFKILLATDFSQAAVNAERYALSLAQDTNSFLLIMHVCDPAKGNNSQVSISDSIAKLGSHVFRHAISGHLVPESINYECIVREGDVLKQIALEANELDVDFIIVGSSGSDKTENPLGTISRQLIMKANIPVISVPSKTSYNKIKRIVFVTGNRDGELPVINHLTKFCKVLDADLSILHLTSEQMSPEFLSRYQEQFLSEIKNKISFPKISLSTHHMNDLSGGLDAYCIESKTDLLVMSPERPQLFEKIYSKSSGISTTYLHNKVPLFTIPDFYSPDYSWFWRSLVPNHSESN